MEKVQIIVQLISESQNSWWRAKAWFYGIWVYLLVHFPSDQTRRYEINGQNAGRREVEEMLKEGGEQYLFVCGELEIVQSIDKFLEGKEQLDELVKRPPEIRLEPTKVNLLLSSEAEVESDDDILVSAGTA